MRTHVHNRNKIYTHEYKIYSNQVKKCSALALAIKIKTVDLISESPRNYNTHVCYGTVNKYLEKNDYTVLN